METRPGTLYKHENVNIYQYPDSIAEHSADEVVTIGDLHGNAMKLLHILIREGILAVDPDSYQAFAELYKMLPGETSDDTARILQDFHDILVLLEPKSPCPTLRLIGDDLADRGKNDLLTLWLFEKMDALKVNYEVLASNHGIEFLKQYAHGLTNNLVTLYRVHDDVGDLDSEHFGKDFTSFGTSYYGLRKAIEDNYVTIEAVDGLLQDSYLPKIKVFTYTVENGELNLFSHAPVNAEKIEILAVIMGVDYKAGNIDEFTHMLDLINAEYNFIVTDKEELRAFISDTVGGYDLFDVVMNGRYEDLAEREDRELLPFIVNNIHGHVAECEISIDHKPTAGWYYINVDTDLGKLDLQHLDEHHYFSYVTHEPDLRKTLQHEVAQPLSRTASTSQFGMFSEKQGVEIEAKSEFKKHL